MSENGPRDPARIVYHAEHRTFARLFHERSLEALKDVVRRKLGLGRDTDVSLKQMGADGLLDLEDDDDFQAFSVLLKSSTSVDIQVTVDRSQGSPVPLPSALVEKAIESVSPSAVGDVSNRVRGQEQLRKRPSVPVATTASSPFRQPVQSVVSGQSGERPEVARTTDNSATAGKTLETSRRKRKVSFSETGLSASKKPAAVNPVTSAVSSESPGAPKPVGAEEPLKKKRKKETATVKDVQITPAVESPSVKVSKPRAKKSVTSNLGSEGEPSAPKDAETPEPPAEKARGRKKDVGRAPRKHSAPVDVGGTSQQINQQNDPVDGTSLQPVSETPRKASAEGSLSKIRQSEQTKATSKVKGTACAAIPQTNESTSVQSEVAAAILSGYLSKGNTPVPPPPPKRKYVRKTAKKPSASSTTLPVESTTMLNAPANEVPKVSTDHGLENTVPTNWLPLQTQGSNGPPCPICLEAPFHIRYCCPIVLKGPDAIRERLEKIKKTNTDDQQQVIKELEGLLRDSKTTSTNDIRSPVYHTSLPGTPIIPSNSYVSEVTVEGRGEGSSSDSSDDVSDGAIEHKDLSVSRRQLTPTGQAPPANDDLEAIVRGPALKRYSVLHVIDRIVEDQDDSDSDSQEVEAELEEDSDEGADQLRCRLSRYMKHSSDFGSEDEESRSPSRLAEVVFNNSAEPAPQNSNEPGEESANRQDDDVVMKDSVNPPVPEEQDDDSSEETHVGSEDRMVVDRESIKEKTAATIVGRHASSPSPRATVLPSSDTPSDEPQEPRESGVDSTSNRDHAVSVASKPPNDAEADPIEPADDLEPPVVARLSNTDPIEVPSEDIGSLFAGAAQSTPKPGVTKRMKTRHSQVLEDEDERPVLLGQLSLEATDTVTPLPAKSKSRRKVTETPASQEPVTTRKSPRFGSLPPSTSTPTAVVLLNHRSKVGARAGRGTKTPAKRSEESLDASQTARNESHIAPTPVRWETLAEPSSPSVQLDEPSVLIDELVSSSPAQDDVPVRGRANGKAKKEKEKAKGRPRKVAPSNSQADNSQEKERLFDLSSSQIPFPYSQHQNNTAPAVPSNGVTETEEMVADSDEEPKVPKKRAELPVRYRPLSQLAAQAVIHSPDLPTPVSKPVMDGKARKRVVEGDSSSSSDEDEEEDEDEANGSQHIPQERRAGSVLPAKRKKSLLSTI